MCRRYCLLGGARGGGLDGCFGDALLILAASAFCYARTCPLVVQFYNSSLADPAGIVSVVGGRGLARGASWLADISPRVIRFFLRHGYNRVLLIGIGKLCTTCTARLGRRRGGVLSAIKMFFCIARKWLVEQRLSVHIDSTTALKYSVDPCIVLRTCFGRPSLGFRLHPDDLRAVPYVPAGGDVHDAVRCLWSKCALVAPYICVASGLVSSVVYFVASLTHLAARSTDTKLVLYQVRV